MSADNGLNLMTVEVWEDKKNRDKYVIAHDPPLADIGDNEIVLAKDPEFEKVIAKATAKNPELSVDKSALTQLSYAYVRRQKGNQQGTKVRILTRVPVIRKVILQTEGKVVLILGDLDDYTRQANVEVGLYEGTKERDVIDLAAGVRRFGLEQAGIAYDEMIQLDMHTRFHQTDENGTDIFGPVSVTQVVINPPTVRRIVREEKEIQLELLQNSEKNLYANIYKDGCNIFNCVPCALKEDKRYVISTDTMNIAGESYALRILCMSDKSASYLSEPISLINERPVVQSVQSGNDGLTIQLKRKGYYCWREPDGTERYGWTDRITIGSADPFVIRYANQCNQTVSLGPSAQFTETSRDGFQVTDGYYYRKDRRKECTLTQQYESFGNDSFAIKEKEGGRSLCIEEGFRDTITQDFKGLLLAQCKTYAQIEELTGCFGEMSLRAEDMLSVKYGYDPQLGVCDIRAGMTLALDYEVYQNIPEVNRTPDSDEPLSNRNLSGFVGNGSSAFRSILRDGKVTFEPFAWDAVKSRRMTVEQTPIGDDGRIGMGVGIWDALCEQFQAPFVKLMYPSVRRQSAHRNHGSMYYYDNVCLVAADSYEKAEEAVKRYRRLESPYKYAAYLCFRGRTTVKILIYIFVEGYPQMCALGSTLGDITAAYGLGDAIILERLCNGKYVPFVVADADIPLYIGDRICSR